MTVERNLAMARRLVLLDEPSQGLAPRIVEEIAAVLQEMRREGIATRRRPRRSPLTRN